MSEIFATEFNTENAGQGLRLTLMVGHDRNPSNDELVLHQGTRRAKGPARKMREAIGGSKVQDPDALWAKLESLGLIWKRPTND